MSIAGKQRFMRVDTAAKIPREPDGPRRRPVIAAVRPRVSANGDTDIRPGTRQRAGGHLFNGMPTDGAIFLQR